jgi:hypothetical protein
MIRTPTDQSVMSILSLLVIKTKYTQRNVFRLVNILYYIACDWTVKDKWNVFYLYIRFLLGWEQMDGLNDYLNIR